MEIFLLISIAMALSTSSTISETYPSSLSSPEGLSSGSFRKSHALLSFFPILCKKSMSLNHRGECIKKQTFSANRKDSTLGLDRNILKHILSKRRRKKPKNPIQLAVSQLSDTKSLNFSQEDSNQTNVSTSTPQPNEFQDTDVNPVTKGSSSIDTPFDIQVDISQDVIVDLIKSTNLIANILQEEIKEQEVQSTISPSVEEEEVEDTNDVTVFPESNYTDLVPSNSLTKEHKPNETFTLKRHDIPLKRVAERNFTGEEEYHSKVENIALAIYNITEEFVNQNVSTNASKVTEDPSRVNISSFDNNNSTQRENLSESQNTRIHTPSSIQTVMPENDIKRKNDPPLLLDLTNLTNSSSSNETSLDLTSEIRINKPQVEIPAQNDPVQTIPTESTVRPHVSANYKDHINLHFPSHSIKIWRPSLIERLEQLKLRRASHYVPPLPLLPSFKDFYRSNKYTQRRSDVEVWETTPHLSQFFPSFNDSDFYYVL